VRVERLARILTEWWVPLNRDVWYHPWMFHTALFKPLARKTKVTRPSYAAINGNGQLPCGTHPKTTAAFDAKPTTDVAVEPISSDDEPTLPGLRFTGAMASCGLLQTRRGVKRHLRLTSPQNRDCLGKVCL
jgi:hypothetical protein